MISMLLILYNSWKGKLSQLLKTINTVQIRLIRTWFKLSRILMQLLEDIVNLEGALVEFSNV